MENYPPNSLPWGNLEDDTEQTSDVDSNLFEDYELKKNIRRLSEISEEMGLTYTNWGKNNVEEKKKGLQDKMVKHRTKLIANKVMDGQI